MVFLSWFIGASHFPDENFGRHGMKLGVFSFWYRREVLSSWINLFSAAVSVRPPFVDLRILTGCWTGGSIVTPELQEIRVTGWFIWKTCRAVGRSVNLTLTVVQRQGNTVDGRDSCAPRMIHHRWVWTTSFALAGLYLKLSFFLALYRGTHFATDPALWQTTLQVAAVAPNNAGSTQWRSYCCHHVTVQTSWAWVSSILLGRCLLLGCSLWYRCAAMPLRALSGVCWAASIASRPLQHHVAKDCHF